MMKKQEYAAKAVDEFYKKNKEHFARVARRLTQPKKTDEETLKGLMN